MRAVHTACVRQARACSSAACSFRPARRTQRTCTRALLLLVLGLEQISQKVWVVHVHLLPPSLQCRLLHSLQQRHLTCMLVALLQVPAVNVDRWVCLLVATSSRLLQKTSIARGQRGCLPRLARTAYALVRLHQQGALAMHNAPLNHAWLCCCRQAHPSRARVNLCHHPQA